MAKIFIVEDNQDQLMTLIKKVELLGHEISGTCLKATNVISEVRKTTPDIILLDINLSGDNEGLVLAEQIRTICNTSIIFITALSSNNIIKNAIATNPTSYLLKPVSLDDLKVNIELALNKKSIDSNGKETVTCLTIRTGNKLRKIEYKNIEFLEIESRNYTTLKLLNGKKVVVRISLKLLCNNILPNFFIQIHRQYAVNTNLIDFIDEKEQMLHLEKNVHLPIGRVYKKGLYKKLNLI